MKIRFIIFSAALFAWIFVSSCVAQNGGSFATLPSAQDTQLQSDLFIQPPIGESQPQVLFTLDGVNVGYGLALSASNSNLIVVNDLFSTLGNWQWVSTTGTNSTLAMVLDTSGNLLLGSGTSEIILQPLGISKIAGSLWVSGTDNELANQVLGGASSILTKGLGDSRYLTLSAAASTYLTSSQAAAAYMPINPTSLSVGGNATMSGTATASSFVGNGSKLTNLSMSQLSGTLSGSQISGTLSSTVNGTNIVGVLHGTGSESPTFGSVNVTGSMGIGTSSPAFKFQVVSGTSQSLGTYTPTTATGLTDFSIGGIGFQFSRPTNGGFVHALYSYGASDGSQNLVISSRDQVVITTGNGMQAATEKVRIMDNGNVGIGTSAPFSSLQIGPATTPGGNAPTFAVTKTASGDDSILFSRINYSSASLGLDSSDIFYLSTQSGLGGIDFRTQGSYFATGGLVGTSVSRLRILDNGNVGINNSSPVASLDIGGSFKVSGTANIGGSLTVSGTANVMPNQTLTAGSNSILTQGLADGRYMSGVAAAATYLAKNQSGSLVFGAGATSDGSADMVIGQSGSGSGVGAIVIGSYGAASGHGSMAIGDSQASGDFSISLGLGASSNGVGTIAVGGESYPNPNPSAFRSVNGAQASGVGSVSLGTGAYADGPWNVVLGLSYASGTENIVQGGAWTAGNYNTAIGPMASVWGNYSNAIGFGSALGQYSTALGFATAEGDYSTASGAFGVAQAYGSTVVGQFNVVQGDSHSWVPTDDLFVIGNGSDNSHPSNAFEVYKNGNAVVSGTLAISGSNPILVQPAGDLSMGIFMNGDKPAN